MGSLYDKVKSGTTTAPSTGGGGSLYARAQSIAGDTQQPVTPEPVEPPASTSKNFVRNAPGNIASVFTGETKLKDVAAEVPGVVARGAKGFADTFVPAITRFFETTGGILGEGLAYAVDPLVREQYKAGNLEILPTVTNTTQAKLAKAVVAAGIETAVYRNIPAAIQGTLIQRGGIGALQGLGFAISEGLANDREPEDIIKSLPEYGIPGAIIGIIAPHLIPVLRAEVTKLPAELRGVFRGLNNEIRPPKPVKLGVQSAEEATRVPISTPNSRYEAYLRSQGYEPYIPETKLPVIEAGPAGRATLPTIRTLNDTPAPVPKGMRLVPEPQTPAAQRLVVGGEEPIRVARQEPRVPTAESIAEEVTDSLRPLIDEAKRFNSADDFIRSRVDDQTGVPLDDIRQTVVRQVEKDRPDILNSDGTITLYHGTPSETAIQKSGNFKTGTYFTADRNVAAQQYANKPGFKVMEVKVDPADLDYTGNGVFTARRVVPLQPKELPSQLRAAFEQSKAGRSREPVIQTEAPTDRITKVSRDELPVGKGEEKVSRLEARVKGLLDTTSPEMAEQAGISTYKQMNKAEQLRKAAEFVEKDPDAALAVLRGDKAAPEGLLHNSIALALEQHAADAADANLAIRLASLRSTRAGQEISILTEADPSNPVSAINEIIEARAKRAERASGTTGERKPKVFVEKQVAEAVQEVSKKRLKIEEAEKILEALKC